MPPPSVELRDRVLLNVDETAAVLGLNTKTVRALLVDTDPVRRLPGFRHGTRWCIPQRQLDGWAAAQTNHDERTPQ